MLSIYNKTKEMHQNILIRMHVKLEKHMHNTKFSSSGALALPIINSESSQKIFKNNGIKLWNRSSSIH